MGCRRCTTRRAARCGGRRRRSGGSFFINRFSTWLDAGACGWKRRGRGDLGTNLIGPDDAYDLDVMRCGKDKQHEPQHAQRYNAHAQQQKPTAANQGEKYTDAPTPPVHLTVVADVTHVIS
jgi:hypothetical protein